ncbi:YecA family protein [Saccharibacillus sacchari]|uniref:YecA family protein n=1 Tax=Saccharibacillus sacchari TaxID=456493 RepID=UPI0004B21046|nr:SEC-C metal-binding domain-containing protein [Saccharibacillus sacchari]
MKIGRNDPCFCGSGKKYKKCCIDRDIAFADSVKFAERKKTDPAFTPRSYYINRVTTLNDRLQNEARSEELDTQLMELAGDTLDDLDGARLHAFTRYGEGFLPTERRLLQALANRLWGALVFGEFQEQEILRPLMAFAASTLAEGISEAAPISGAILTTDEDGNLLNASLKPAAEGEELEVFELDIEIEGVEL